MRASKVRDVMSLETYFAQNHCVGMKELNEHGEEVRAACVQLEALEELAGAVVKAYEAQVDPIGFATLEPLLAIVTKAELEEVPA